jgi:hypothetical protein
VPGSRPDGRETSRETSAAAFQKHIDNEFQNQVIFRHARKIFAAASDFGSQPNFRQKACVNSPATKQQELHTKLR